jgi:hypothetical protein
MRHLVGFHWESKGRSGSIDTSIKWNQFEYTLNRIHLKLKIKKTVILYLQYI